MGKHIPQEHDTLHQRRVDTSNHLSMCCAVGGALIVGVRGCMMADVLTASLNQDEWGWERYMEWYWDPHWLYFYWKNISCSSCSPSCSSWPFLR